MPDVIDKLIGFYSLEQEQYERLLDLANMQGTILTRETMEPEDTEALGEIYETEEAVIKMIAELGEEIRPLSRTWWERDDITSKQRSRLNSVLGQILGLIEKVMAQEQENDRLLAEKQVQVHSALRSLQ